MSNVFRSALLFVVLQLGVGQGAAAKETPGGVDYNVRKAPGGADCASLLSTQPAATPLDFELSDLEGAFIELVQKVQTAGEIAPGRSEYFIRDLMNLKADLLNQVTDLLPQVVLKMPEGDKQKRALNTLYLVVDTMGIDPGTWGLVMNKKTGILTVAGAPRSPGKIVPSHEPEVPNNPIGFVTPVGAGRSDVPEGFHRSIGFGTPSVTANDSPLRKTGYITRGLHPEYKTIMLIADNEKKAVYAIDLRFMTAPGAQTEHQRFSLDFNSDIREWIVKVENLANPSGKIGFLN